MVEHSPKIFASEEKAITTIGKLVSDHWNVSVSYSTTGMSMISMWEYWDNLFSAHRSYDNSSVPDDWRCSQRYPSYSYHSFFTCCRNPTCSQTTRRLLGFLSTRLSAIRLPAAIS